MRPREIWEFIWYLTGSFAESEAELTSPKLQPLILVRRKRRRKTTVIQPSASQDTHLFSQSHGPEALQAFLFLFLCFISLVIISSYLLWLAACESSLYRENFLPKQTEPSFKQEIKHCFSFFLSLFPFFPFFLSSPSLFCIKAVPDWALEKETQVPLGLRFDCLLLYLIPVHFHKGRCGAF